MLRHQDAEATPPVTEVGDTVKKIAPERTCKLTSEFFGPYLVSVKMHGNKYKLLKPDTNTTELIHVDRLKKGSAALFAVAPSLSGLVSPSDACFRLQDAR